MGLFFREVKPKFDLFTYLEEHQGEVAILAGLLLLLLLLVWRCLSAGIINREIIRYMCYIFMLLFTGKNVPDKNVPEPVPPQEELHLPIADNSTEEEAADRSTPRRSARLRNKRSASTN